VLVLDTAPAARADEAIGGSHDSLEPIHSRYARTPRLSPIVGKFAARLRERIDAARTAHAGGDFDDLSRFAHWLVGSAGMTGYDSLTAPARELEALANAHDAAGSSTVLARMDGMCERLVVPESVAAS